MSGKTTASASNALRRLFTQGTLTGLSEQELLERFVSEGDEEAFRALLQRYGPMVLGICRRFLTDEQEIEDAYQATFLVLVRKAGSIRHGERLGNWLYGVALRVASKARANALKRAERERPANAEPWVEPEDPAERREAVAALLEEIGRLPERYRAPVVLCHLEGHTHDEAARTLRWPVGTVRGRLFRARSLLQRRLTKRGLAGLAPLVPGLIGRITEAKSACSFLNTRTLATAVKYAAGRGLAAGAVPASVLALIEGGRPMIIGKMAHLGIGTTIGGLLVAGSVTVAPQDEEDSKPDDPTSAVRATAAESGASGVEASGEPAASTGRHQTPELGVLEAQLQAKRLELLAATTALENARKQLTQAERLVEKGAAAEGTPDRHRVNVLELEARVAQKSAEVLELRHRFRQAEATWFQRIAEAEGELKMALSKLERAKQRVEWASRMHDQGYITEAQFHSDKRNLEQAQAGVLQARRRLEALRGDAPQEQERRDDKPGAARTTVTVDRLDLSGALERRLETIERKLDRVLELLEAAEPSDGDAPSRR